jgi:hypothetical protein
MGRANLRPLRYMDNLPGSSAKSLVLHNIHHHNVLGTLEFERPILAAAGRKLAIIPGQIQKTTLVYRTQTALLANVYSFGPLYREHLLKES